MKTRETMWAWQKARKGTKTVVNPGVTCSSAIAFGLYLRTLRETLAEKNPEYYTIEAVNNRIGVNTNWKAKGHVITKDLEKYESGEMIPLNMYLFSLLEDYGIIRRVSFSERTQEEEQAIDDLLGARTMAVKERTQTRRGLLEA